MLAGLHDWGSSVHAEIGSSVHVVTGIVCARGDRLYMRLPYAGCLNSVWPYFGFLRWVQRPGVDPGCSDVCEANSLVFMVL